MDVGRERERQRERETERERERQRETERERERKRERERDSKGEREKQKEETIGTDRKGALGAHIFVRRVSVYVKEWPNSLLNKGEQRCSPVQQVPEPSPC